MWLSFLCIYKLYSCSLAYQYHLSFFNQFFIYFQNFKFFHLRFQLEAMNRSLKDIMQTELPFGGKILFLAGDLRQCLPVIPGGNRGQVVDSCIVRSHLWPSFKVLNLNINMRVAAGNNLELQDFDRWQVSIGDGVDIGASDKVQLPAPRVFSIKKNTRASPNAEGKCMIDFCKLIYPDLANNINDPEFLQHRAILAPTNVEVDTINSVLLSLMPEEVLKVYSSDNFECLNHNHHLYISTI